MHGGILPLQIQLVFQVHFAAFGAFIHFIFHLGGIYAHIQRAKGGMIAAFETAALLKYHAGGIIAHPLHGYHALFHGENHVMALAVIGLGFGIINAPGVPGAAKGAGGQ